MEQRDHFRALTSLKGLFILIIALHNTLADTQLFSGIPGTSFLVLFGGALGNSMFFILSGFLLSHGYKNRIRNHSISFGTFLLRRLKKLYPMYILSNLVAFASEVARYGASAINLEKLVFTVLLKVGGLGEHSPYNKPTWFLCALLICYVLFFAICYHARTHTQYLSGITALVILGYSLISPSLQIPYLGDSEGVAYMNFFLGCILAEVYPLISRKLHRWMQPAFLVALPVCLYLMLSYGVEIIAGDVKIAFAFMICPMILYLALVKGPCRAILQFRGFVFLGKISSCIFFWHLVLYQIFCEVFGSVGEIRYLIYFLGMIAFSAAAMALEEAYRKKITPAVT
jgi:peptidoglycan/LPS O-acetylase OafA/YrhL